MLHNPINPPQSPEVGQCIQNCLDCYDLCTATFQQYYYLADAHGDLSSLAACAELCQTCASVIQMNSQLQSQMCGLCLEACEYCANDCERLAMGDAQLLKCAEICRRCADSCYYMVMLPMYSVAYSA